MWPTSNPPECRVAEQLLAENNPLEAARILLAATDLDHRAVRELRERIGVLLVARGRKAAEANQVRLAVEMLDCAARCKRLSADEEFFRQRMVIQSRHLPPDRKENDAEFLARASTGPYLTPVHSRTPDIKQSPVSFGQPSSPHKLTHTERRFECLVEANSSRSIVLEGLDAYGRLLAITRPTVLIGRPQERGVDFPLEARILGKHALLVREPAGGGRERWRLVALNNSATEVNGISLVAPDTRVLVDGDVLQWGSDLCRWMFRLPVLNSATAILEVVRPTAVGVVLDRGDTAYYVALIADELIISATRGHGHLVQRDLPGPALTLVPNSKGWFAWSAAPLFANRLKANERGVPGELGEETGDDDDLPITLPAKLTLYADDTDLARQIVCNPSLAAPRMSWSLRLRH